RVRSSAASDVYKRQILDNGSMTISIRQNQEIIDKFGDVAFDKESLTLSLINHSSKIFNT
uniref:hypothetical protein n=1 Tax=uncultured Campylobacter sp. TaxID=218934 RepID=UPI0025ECAFB4